MYVCMYVCVFDEDFELGYRHTGIKKKLATIPLQLCVYTYMTYDIHSYITYTYMWYTHTYMRHTCTAVHVYVSLYVCMIRVLYSELSTTCSYMYEGSNMYSEVHVCQCIH